MKKPPLAGTRVLDFGMNIAGPFAGSVLADYGADVIKIESPEGDSARAYQPEHGGVSALFAANNHNKRYVCLDLRHIEAPRVLARLIERADVLIQNFRPGRAVKLGIDAASCHQLNSRLIHASIEAFYPVDGDRPGYDTLVQAECGLMAMTGFDGGEPARIPAAAIDQVTGLWTASAVLAALAGERNCTVIETSLLDVGIGLLNEKVANFLIDGKEPKPMGSGTSVTTPQEAYQTADGHLVIAAATDAFFLRLAKELGPPVHGDQRFTSQSGRLDNRAALTKAITGVLVTASTQTWYEKLSAAGIPVGQVRPLSAAVARHARNSATGIRTLSPSGLKILAPPVRLSGVARADGRVPGRIGADTDAVLGEVGFDPAEIARLRKVGVAP